MNIYIYMCVCVCIYIYMYVRVYIDRFFGIMVRLFADGLGNWDSIPSRVIPKTQKYYMLPLCSTSSECKKRRSDLADTSVK